MKRPTELLASLALSAALAGCAGTHAENSPRLDAEITETVVFRYGRAETRRYDDAAQVRDFMNRLNTARGDTTLKTVNGLCRIDLRGREGTQHLRVSGKEFRLSGPGCRFRQAHCNYRADFDLEALCRPPEATASSAGP